MANWIKCATDTCKHDGECVHEFVVLPSDRSGHMFVGVRDPYGNVPALCANLDTLLAIRAEVDKAIEALGGKSDAQRVAELEQGLRDDSRILKRQRAAVIEGDGYCCECGCYMGHDDRCSMPELEAQFERITALLGERPAEW